VDHKSVVAKKPRRYTLMGQVTAVMQAGALLILVFRCLPVAAASPTLLTVTAGPCELTNDGTCVTDGPGEYGNDERCLMHAMMTVTLSASAFNTEHGFDYVTIGGTLYSGTSGPNGVVMAAGETFTWFSDASNTRSGFVICASSAPQLVPPKPPAPPPPLAPPPVPPTVSNRVLETSL
jgi:hypothetical protein